MTGPGASTDTVVATMAALAEREPGRNAVTFEGQTRSRSDLERNSNRLARAFAELGVGEGSFVTIALPNGVCFIETVLAAWKLGAVPQPVSHQLSATELGEIIELVEPALIVGLDADPGLGRPILTIDNRTAGGHSDDALPPKTSPSWKAPTSGGSTGRPKVIVAGEPSAAGALMPYADLYRISAETVMLMTGPLYHNGPFMNTMLTLLCGGHVVITARFDATDALRLIQHHGVTSLYAVPTMMHRIWRLPEQVRRDFDVSTLRTVLHTAAPCPAWLKRAWIDWLGPERIFEIYGGTEAQAMTALDGAEWLRHQGSVGRVRLGEMKVVDDQGRECPAGRPGRIMMRRGAGAPPTYRYIGATAVTHHGWDWLGDTGTFDADGYLYVADRETDLILVGGANVYPAEIEAVLDEHPLIASSCVIGLPHPDLGSVPHAIVETSGASDEEMLRAYVAERLVPYKRPRSYEFVDHPLRDESGKVRRGELRTARVAPERRDGRPDRGEADA